MSKSPIYEEIVQEGTRSSIVTVLMERFGAVSEETIEPLNDLDDATELSRLLRLAVRCASLDEFAANLPAMATA